MTKHILPYNKKKIKMIFTLFLREDEITTRWWVVVTHPLGSLHSLDPQEQFSSVNFVKCQREAVPRQRLAPEVIVWCCPLWGDHRGGQESVAEE